MVTRAIPSGAPDMALAAKVGPQLLRLKDELTQIFPEREYLVTQLIYALLTREHVLVHGPVGTGKSDLLSTLFQAFEDSTLFSIGLSKFMNEGQVVGAIDPKKLRDEGKIEHNIEGSILEAHFAELDELFDANAPLLRVLLGILNERHFKRGRQFIRAKLHTAVGSTNGDPDVEVKRQDELRAVVDRFLFQCKVVYLDGKDSRMRMYEKYCNGEKPETRISFEELAQVSEIVVGINQITDPRFFSVYDDVLQAFKKAVPDLVISDRRACKLLKIVEANAVLHGRYEVDYEDILAIRWGLFHGDDKEKHAKFDEVAAPIIAKAKEDDAQDIDVLQKGLLVKIKDSLPEVVADMPADALVQTRKALSVAKQEAADVKPTLDSTLKLQRELIAEIESRIKAATDQMGG